MVLQSGLKMRFAEEEDMPVLLDLIRELAKYEKRLEHVTATEELLAESLFAKEFAEALIVEHDEEPIGYALYFYNFSTFIGKPGIYLEDVYIRPQHRGRGFGKAVLAFLAKLAEDRGCWGLEWTCLEWNKNSMEFYDKLGAKQKAEWRVYRLAGEPLRELSKSAML